MTPTLTPNDLTIGSPVLFRLNSWFGNRPKWQRHRITGETNGTWLLEDGTAVNKKTLLSPKDSRDHQDRYFTTAQARNRDFCDKHARDIGIAVSGCGDTEKLKQIAKLIGKELKE